MDDESDDLSSNDAFKDRDYVTRIPIKNKLNKKKLSVRELDELFLNNQNE